MRIEIVPAKEMEFPRKRKSKYQDIIDKVLESDYTEAVMASCSNAREMKQINQSVRYTLARKDICVTIRVNNDANIIYIRKKEKK